MSFTDRQTHTHTHNTTQEHTDTDTWTNNDFIICPMLLLRTGRWSP